MEVGLGPGHIVLDGNPVLPPQKGYSRQFWPMSAVAKRLDGSKCHSVGRYSLRWDPTPSPKGAQPPIFDPCLLWSNGRQSQLLLSTYRLTLDKAKQGSRRHHDFAPVQFCPLVSHFDYRPTPSHYRHYTTYCTVVIGGPNHGIMCRKSREVWICF